MIVCCNICNSNSSLIFETRVLNKYNVKYFQCTYCLFIQTENPYWLPESYNNAITDLDIGLLDRNIKNRVWVSKLIDKNFIKSSTFIDYGGGYGIFVRLMRDIGYNFYRQDNFCDNLFSQYYDITDLEKKEPFELLTAFEVFEHLVNPKVELEKMLIHSENILFSTEVQPEVSPLNPNNWWYFVPEIGQHISLYSRKSLETLSKQYDLNYYYYSNFHLFTKKKFNSEILKEAITDSIWKKFLNKLSSNTDNRSLLQNDFEYIKARIISR